MATVITYRSKHDIRREILALVSPGPMKRTHVMYAAKMSYPQLIGYLADLTANGLITEDADKVVSITSAGKKKLALLNEALA